MNIPNGNSKHFSKHSYKNYLVLSLEIIRLQAVPPKIKPKILSKNNKKPILMDEFFVAFVAGEEGFEPSAYGFGDNWPFHEKALFC